MLQPSPVTAQRSAAPSQGPAAATRLVQPPRLAEPPRLGVPTHRESPCVEPTHRVATLVTREPRLVVLQPQPCLPDLARHLTQLPRARLDQPCQRSAPPLCARAAQA